MDSLWSASSAAGCIVGGELCYHNDDQAVTFKSHDEEQVARWLKATGWHSKVDPVKLRFALWKL
jgi:hypothetical protein